MVVVYAKEIGFEGQFLIEPKPKEPTKHQYDFDVATVLAFLRKLMINLRAVDIIDSTSKIVKKEFNSRCENKKTNFREFAII